MQNMLLNKYTIIAILILGACGWFGGIEDVARKRGRPLTQWQKIGMRFAFVVAGFICLVMQRTLDLNAIWAINGVIILGIPVQIVAWLMPEHPDSTTKHVTIESGQMAP